MEKSRWGSSIGKKSPESKSIKLVTIVIVIVTGVIIWHRSWSCFKIKIISVFRVIETGLPRCFQLASLNLEFESMKTSSDQLGQEKWELTQVNTDLQQRLQQTVALARMQVS